MSDFLSIFSIGLFQNTLRTATPVVLAALGILMTDHVGIMNIGMDGMMLTTAFFAVLGSVFLGGWLGGLALAMAVGLLMGAFFALFVVKFKSDEYIIGVALNIFAAGLRYSCSERFSVWQARFRETIRCRFSRCRRFAFR